MTATIRLGSQAADLEVMVQRGADAVLALRLTAGEQDVTEQYGAVILHGRDATPWIAELEDVDGAPALVWRQADVSWPVGSQSARLEVTHTESGAESCIGVGRVIVQ